MYSHIGFIPIHAIRQLREWHEREEKFWQPLAIGHHRVHIWRHPIPDVELPVVASGAWTIRLDAGASIQPHVDDVHGRETFHFPLWTNSECFVFSDHGVAIRQHLEVGNYYSVDRARTHWSVNGGKTDRIHLVLEA